MLRYLQDVYGEDLKTRGVVFGHDHRARVEYGLSSEQYCNYLVHIFVSA